jgi:hypothetical protein
MSPHCSDVPDSERANSQRLNPNWGGPNQRVSPVLKVLRVEYQESRSYEGFVDLADDANASVSY